MKHHLNWPNFVIFAMIISISFNSYRFVRFSRDLNEMKDAIIKLQKEVALEKHVDNLTSEIKSLQ